MLPSIIQNNFQTQGEVINMEQHLYKILAILNKILLPSFTKQRRDLAKMSKFQLAIFGWRLFVTKKSLD
jgi:hypothetical protein